MTFPPPSPANGRVAVSPECDQSFFKVGSIVGYIDCCDGSSIAGWVADSNAWDHRLEIDVLVDGERATRIVADCFRPDLLKAGIGDGRYGFRLATPLQLFDDEDHVIEVRKVLTGEFLWRSPKPFRATLSDRSNIRLVGDALIGWARFPQAVKENFALEVIEEETVVCSGEGLPDSAVASIVHFCLHLPPAVLDSRIHRFTVRGRSPRVIVGNLEVRTPEVQPLHLHDMSRSEQGAEAKGAALLKSGHEFVSGRGRIEAISRGVISGYLLPVTEADPRDALLEFVLDGRTIGTARPTIVRPDIEEASEVDYRCGFEFDLRPHLQELSGQQLIVREVNSGQILTTTPISLDPTTGWGILEGIFGIELRGWATRTSLDAENVLVDILIDGEIVGSVSTAIAWKDHQRTSIRQLVSGFRFLIPTRWHDGQSHTLAARIRGCSEELPGSGIRFRCEIESHIDVFSSSRVSGWIINLAAPDYPVPFDLWVGDRCVRKNVIPSTPRHDVEKALLGDSTVGHLNGFDLLLPEADEQSERPRRVALCLPGTRENLSRRAVIALDRLDVLKYIEEMASRVCVDSRAASTVNLTEACGYAFRTQLIPQIMSNLRGAGFEQPVLIRPALPRVQRSTDQEDRIVDVIIPVYKGYRETIDCVHSVLTTRNETPLELVVVNDCSPDTRLCLELRRLAELEGFTLLENEKNRGFVASVNRGMRLHRDRDVLLLNSDTIVPRGWLRALRRAAYSAPNIATVTPFSNRATIFSLPRTCFDNDMPLGLSVDEMNAICARCNDGVIVDVPTGVGFCMYIRREALDEVGFFNEERWARGYGEENDFCLSALALGWRHVAACDVFVQHHGAVSFEDEKTPRVRENLAKLHMIYPDYPLRIQRYIESDPLAVPRGRVNMALLKRLGTGFMLFVTHGLGGGTETAIRDFVRLNSSRGEKILILRSVSSGKLVLSPAMEPYEETLAAEYPRDTRVEVLAEHLRDLEIESICFHHTLGFHLDIWRLPDLLGVPYDVMIHDYFMACPRINLTDSSGFYCGQPETAVCERCVKSGSLEPVVRKQLAESGGTVSSWRKFHAARLAGARRVTAPTDSACEHFRKSLPVENIEVTPHPELPLVIKWRPRSRMLPHRIAVLGAIAPHKGADLLLACARQAERENLPLQFIVIGHTSCDDDLAVLENVEITGRYEPYELGTLIENSGCSVALFLSVWPETHCYALSEAWRFGLYPIAMDIGALGERIRRSGAGALIPYSQNPREILASVLEVLDRHHPSYALR